MILIDLTYLERKPLYIPFANNTGSGISRNVDANKRAEITNYFDVLEVEYLNFILGEDLYAEYIAGLAEDPIDEKWTNLSSQLVNSTLKISPIANYCFFYYLEIPKLTDIGVVLPKVENGTFVASYPLQIRAWNRMVEMNERIVDWLLENGETYNYEHCAWLDGLNYKHTIDFL